MMRFTQVLTVTLTSLVLLACSSQPAYRAAEGEGGYGYNETQLSDTQYRVTFKARGTDKNMATNYAMLRAAEVTLMNDFDWFVISHRETTIDKETVRNPDWSYTNSREMVTYCSATGCYTRSYPSSAFSAGIHVGGRTDSDIAVNLEIRMGNGKQPDTNHSYNAKQVRDNLQTKISEEN